MDVIKAPADDRAAAPTASRWIGVGASTDPDSHLAGVTATTIALRGAAEVKRVTSFTGRAPVAGCSTYDEIARAHGVNGFHNQTLVVLAFG